MPEKSTRLTPGKTVSVKHRNYRSPHDDTEKTSSRSILRNMMPPHHYDVPATAYSTLPQAQPKDSEEMENLMEGTRGSHIIPHKFGCSDTLLPALYRRSEEPLPQPTLTHILAVSEAEEEHCLKPIINTTYGFIAPLQRKADLLSF